LHEADANRPEKALTCANARRKGQYVALTDEDFRRANVKATQTIDIASFTDAADVPPVYFDTPYFLAPAKGGEKVYALLREALKRSGKTAVAKVHGSVAPQRLTTRLSLQGIQGVSKSVGRIARPAAFPYISGRTRAP
jgi:Ku70/Ku80 beta-barrel domain